MSITMTPSTQYAAGKPCLFWQNRTSPFVIGSEVAAHNGRVAIVRTTVSGEIGKPMRVLAILAKKAHIDAWKILTSSNPFNTTSLVSEFVTGHTVLFRIQEPMTEPQNMVLKDGSYDIDQSIFSSGSGSYKVGFDLWSLYLNLIIVT